ncbi:MAG: hypothetical protein ACK4R7_06190 [Fervidobacterium sp.]
MEKSKLFNEIETKETKELKETFETFALRALVIDEEIRPVYEKQLLAYLLGIETRTCSNMNTSMQNAFSIPIRD